MTGWRAIKCCDVDWYRCGGSRRAAHKVRHLCHFRPEPDPYLGSGEWSTLTLGQLADMGERAWLKPSGMGVLGQDVIRRTIDAAAEGVDVTNTVATDAYVPRIERPR